MQFGLPAGDGYTLQVKTEGDLARITVWRANPLARASAATPLRAPSRGLYLAATYHATGAVSGEAIDADLGPLGAIHVRFVPSGRTRTVHLERGEMPPGCRAPHRLLRRLGSFEGSISFHGEGGYATVEATSAPGAVGPSASRRCSGAALLRYAGAPPLTKVERIWLKSDASLFARYRSPRGHTNMTWFLASTMADGAHYSVERFERLQSGLFVQRSVSVSGPTTGFSYRPDLVRATLTPPAPFSGEATYSSDGGRLNGDLAVELPGLEPQPLTGSQFEARISSPR